MAYRESMKWNKNSWEASSSTTYTSRTPATPAHRKQVKWKEKHPPTFFTALGPTQQWPTAASDTAFTNSAAGLPAALAQQTSLPSTVLAEVLSKPPPLTPNQKKQQWITTAEDTLTTALSRPPGHFFTAPPTQTTDTFSCEQPAESAMDYSLQQDIDQLQAEAAKPLSDF